MKRRTFIKLTGMGIVGMSLPSCLGENDHRTFKTSTHTDLPRGHQIFSGKTLEEGEVLTHDLLIIGGGLAGLAAAFQAKEKDYIVCEISDRWGGSSGAIKIDGNLYCQGAHYDLAYPDHYGKDALNLLKELGITQFDEKGKIWNFKDKKHLIPDLIKSRSFIDGDLGEYLFEDREMAKKFYKFLWKYEGQMTLPTTQAKESVKDLDNITFKNLLDKNVELDEEFYRALDYQLIDDYGAGSEEISAYSGVHYFKCRPYKTQYVQLFSPAEGNHYFVNKLVQCLVPEKLKLNNGILKITDTEDGFSAKVFNAKTEKLDVINCKNIVYAGQKHALKHVYPKDQALFNHSYAPWLVVNVHTKTSFDDENTFWQNEILNEDKRLLGFVNSKSQNEKSKDQVFTFYFCFSPEERKYLKDLKQHEQELANECVGHLERIFDRDLSNEIDCVYFKPMGHAMPIPSTGYLFQNKNSQRSNKKISYAGVDTGRLPLLFEAIDSGIQAVKDLNLGS